jgi:glucose-6-phosphate 1-epimerase
MTFPIVCGAGNLPKVILVARDGARAEIFLHGAHLTSWIPAGEGGDRLFLSACSRFSAGAAIRGGIPVSFPQFATQGPLPNHGFARVTPWDLAQAGLADDGSAVAVLRVADSGATQLLWPHAFVLELAVRLSGPWLEVGLTVSNTGPTSFTFTAALHTYLAVADVASATVHGLEGALFRDKVLRRDDCRESETSLRVTGEIDRVYRIAPPDLEVRERGRSMAMRASGFPDTVIWNPGATGAGSLADLESGGEQRMLCVEAAAATTPVVLAAGATWRGSQRLTAR